MKWWIISGSFLLSFLATAQRPGGNFSAIDWRAASIDAPTTDSLAKLLTAPYSTELQKVRSIFRWITEHIDYRTGRYRSLQSIPVFSDTSLQWKSADEMTAEMVFQRRSGVCEGYACLFKTLCQYAGIQAEIVEGYVSGGSLKRFGSNHSWNSVRIDSSWYLLDVTWASGYVSFGNEFVRHYDDYYFLTDPEQLIRTHFPEDLQWSLLAKTPVAREFNQMPFRLRSFIKYGFTAYTPSKGVIEASPGDTITIVLETNDPDKDRRIGSDPFFDTAVFNRTDWIFLKPGVTVHPKKVHYTYVVGSTNAEWLHLLYNDDVVLRYKLKFRKEDRTAARPN